jgi:hypothetical protein
MTAKIKNLKQEYLLFKIWMIISHFQNSIVNSLYLFNPIKKSY